jgi:hypothetical protein
MDRKLAQAIQANLIDGRNLADAIREEPPARADDRLTTLVDAYVESLMKMNELLAKARPFYRRGVVEEAGILSFVGATLWVNSKKGPLVAGVFAAGWMSVSPAIRYIQGRMG